MDNILAKKFSLISLLKFALPNIIMMVFTSMYTIVDGIFITHFAGTLAISALNMSYPVTCIIMGLGIMIGTGSSASLATKMGMGKTQEAKRDFTFIIIISLIISIVIAVFTNLFMDEILGLLGTTKLQFDLAKSYTVILMTFTPAFMLQLLYQSLFVTAGKPQVGLVLTVIAGISNIVLDYLFIVVLNMGIVGAAYGTCIGYCIPAGFGTIYFFLKRKGTLYFVKPFVNFKMFLYSCANGSSEMVANLATAVTTFLFNIQFLKFYNEDGVAAISIVLYYQFVFSAVFYGYSMGIAPIISFKHGAGDNDQKKIVFKISMMFIAIVAISMFILSLILIKPSLMFFTEEGSNTFNIIMEGFWIFALGFLFCGFTIFASSLFTALSDGKHSAIISFARTFLFLSLAIIVIPIFAGGIGIWIAVPVAEGLGFVFALYFILKYKKSIYGYYK